MIMQYIECQLSQYSSCSSWIITYG